MSRVNIILLTLLLTILPCLSNNVLAQGMTNNQRTVEKSNAEKLQDAAMKGRLSDVRAFLDAGVSVNASPREGWTALMAAATFGHKDIVSYLLSHGALVN